MLKYKVGDKVKVLQGRDRGREGTIERIFPKKMTALVPGVNVFKKHIKAGLARDGKGGIYDIPRPISLSKLAVIDPNTKKVARVAFRLEGDKKIRVNAKTKKILGKISTKQK